MRNAPLAPGRAQLGAPRPHAVRPGSGSVQGVPALQPEWEETNFGPRAACQDRAEAVGTTAPDLCTDISKQASSATHSPMPGCCAAWPPPSHRVTFWQHSATRALPTPSKSNDSPALSPTAWPGQPDSQPAPLSPPRLRGQYQNHQHMHSTSWCCRGGRGHGGHRKG